MKELTVLSLFALLGLACGLLYACALYFALVAKMIIEIGLLIGRGLSWLACHLRRERSAS